MDVIINQSITINLTLNEAVWLKNYLENQPTPSEKENHFRIELHNELHKALEEINY